MELKYTSSKKAIVKRGMTVHSIKPNNLCST